MRVLETRPIDMNRTHSLKQKHCPKVALLLRVFFDVICSSTKFFNAIDSDGIYVFTYNFFF